ncbi:MAG: hypothetical protein CSA05_01650 [Bacteroidia bacterium]|nr:MAG: hypothetical protein CSA05_01650 [Bacteroidia bacterium]
MKKIFIFAFLLVISVSVFAQTKSASMSFKNTHHDFGKIKEVDGAVSTVFNFVNTGKEPVIIGKVKATCGCTTPTWTNTPIPPGGSGFVKAVYDPRNRPGKFNKSITVTSNSENSPVFLRISGEVIQREPTIEDLYRFKIGDIRLKQNMLPFTRIYNTSVRSQTIEIVNVGNKEVSIGFERIPEHISVKAEPIVLKPKEKGKIKVSYDANKKRAWGYVVDRFYLKLNDGKFDGANRITVSATISEDFSKLTEEEKAKAPLINFTEKSFDFGTLTQGQSITHEFEFKNAGKSDLMIREVKASCGCTAVKPNKKQIAPGETATIKVTFNTRGKRGRQSKSITIISNDPQNSRTVLWIKGMVNMPEK